MKIVEVLTYGTGNEDDTYDYPPMFLKGNDGSMLQPSSNPLTTPEFVIDPARLRPEIPAADTVVMPVASPSIGGDKGDKRHPQTPDAARPFRS